jgi:hypothetical protein
MICLVLTAGIVFCAPADVGISVDEEYTTDTSIMLNLNASDNATWCQLSNDGSTFENVSDPLSFPLSYSWTIEDDEGVNTVYFKCADDNESWSEVVSDDVILDSTDPEANNLSPADGSSTSITTPTISAFLNDPGDSDSGIDEDSIELTVDGDVVAHSFDSSPPKIIFTPDYNLASGTHEVVLDFSDIAGNEVTTTWSFFISSGISLGDKTPASGVYLAVNRPEISIGIYEEGAGINESSINMSVDGVDVTDEIEFSDDAITYSPDDDLSEGNITVEVVVSDDAGETAEAEWSFYIDRSDPSITAPLPDSGSTISSITEISVFLEDSGSGINESTIVMEIDGIDVMSDVDYEAEDGKLLFDYVEGMNEGTHDVDVTVEDMSGNEASLFWSFTLAKSAPSVSSKTPEPDSEISDAMPRISAELSASEGLEIDESTIRLYLDRRDITSESTYDLTSGELYFEPSEALDDGEHTVRVKAAYAEGGETDVEWDFFIDATAPERATGLIVDLNGDETKLTWAKSASDDVGGYKIYTTREAPESLSDMVSAGTVGANTTSYTHDGKRKYYFAVVAYDDLGNEAKPAYGQNCGDYSDGKWYELECCWDFQCGVGGVCDLEENLCTEGSGEITDDSEDDVSKFEAERMIEDAEQVILDAALSGTDVQEVGSKMDQAESAFNMGNYDQAYELALQAKEMAQSAAPAEEEAEVEETDGKKENPCCPSLLILPLIGLAAFFRR